MSVVTLADGRRVVGEYDFARDWWVVRVAGDDRLGEAHWVHDAVGKLFEIGRGRSLSPASEAVQARIT
jgi:hypothetical protein